MYKYCDIIIKGTGAGRITQIEQLYNAYGKLVKNFYQKVNKTVLPEKLPMEYTKLFGHLSLTGNYQWKMVRLGFPRFLTSGVFNVLRNHFVDCCMQNKDLQNVDNRVKITKNKQIKVYYHLNNQEADHHLYHQSENMLRKAWLLLILGIPVPFKIINHRQGTC